jgi:hypothetical protein
MFIIIVCGGGNLGNNLGGNFWHVFSEVFCIGNLGNHHFDKPISECYITHFS